MEIKKLGLDKESLKYRRIRHVETLADLMKYPRLKRDIENKDNTLIKIVKALTDDDAEALKVASPLVYRWIKYSTFIAADGSRDMKENVTIGEMLGFLLIHIPDAARGELSEEGYIDSNGKRIISHISDVFYIEELRPFIKRLSLGEKKDAILKGHPYQDFKLVRAWYPDFLFSLTYIEDIKNFAYLFKKVRTNKKMFSIVFPDTEMEYFYLTKLLRLNIQAEHKTLRSILKDENLSDNIKSSISKYISQK